MRTMPVFGCELVTRLGRSSSAHVKVGKKGIGYERIRHPYSKRGTLKRVCENRDEIVSRIDHFVEELDQMPDGRHR